MTVLCKNAQSGRKISKHKKAYCKSNNAESKEGIAEIKSTGQSEGVSNVKCDEYRHNKSSNIKYSSMKA